MKLPPDTQFRERVLNAFGIALAEELPARVGNPVDHAILVDNTDRDGLVYVHGLGSDPQSAYTAINNLGKDALTYDAPVKVKRVVNGYQITSKDLELWDKFWAGTVIHDQQPVLLSQIMYGTAQPTNPASMRVQILGAVYDVEDTAYRGSDQLSADFMTSPLDVDSVAIDVPTTPLVAIGVCVQVDPTTDTLSYKQGAAFPASMTHKQAFDAGYYPQRDTDRRRITWLRLVTGMTAISYEHFYNAPELLNSGGGGVTDHGELTGLADDDHTQYALLAGRTGGQTLIGGTGAGDDLTLQTTSNGTKGSYILSELTTAGPVITSAAGVLSSKAQLDTAEIADNAVTLYKLAGGTAGKVIGFDGAGDPAELTVELPIYRALIEDHKTNGTDGGTFPSGANRTRDLNWKRDPNGICSIERLEISSGGTYEIKIGDVVEGDTSGTTATVWSLQNVSGAWSTGDWAGYLWLGDDATGAFTVAETLHVGAEPNVATVVADATNNQIRLKTGYVYWLKAVTEAYAVIRNKASIQDVTNATTLAVGHSCYARDTSFNGAPASVWMPEITPVTDITIELQHQCENTKTGNGFGVASSFGVDEVYSSVELYCKEAV
jgi:hypothetical protein